jgi:hypothetical protein
MGVARTQVSEPAGRRGREARAESAGRDWAASVRLELHSEGRRAAGGWPGTMSEARAQVARTMGPTSSSAPDEVSRLARILYSAARESWLLHRDPASEDD